MGRICTLGEKALQHGIETMSLALWLDDRSVVCLVIKLSEGKPLTSEIRPCASLLPIMLTVSLLQEFKQSQEMTRCVAESEKSLQTYGGSTEAWGVCCGLVTEATQSLASVVVHNELREVEDIWSWCLDFDVCCHSRQISFCASWPHTQSFHVLFPTRLYQSNPLSSTLWWPR